MLHFEYWVAKQYVVITILLNINHMGTHVHTHKHIFTQEEKRLKGNLPDFNDISLSIG